MKGKGRSNERVEDGEGKAKYEEKVMSNKK